MICDTSYFFAHQVNVVLWISILEAMSEYKTHVAGH